MYNPIKLMDQSPTLRKRGVNMAVTATPVSSELVFGLDNRNRCFGQQLIRPTAPMVM